MRFPTFLCLTLTLLGCATPRVWVLKQDYDAGIIAYENYDPKSDGGKRIRNLIPCDSYRMTANPINRMSNGTSGYYYGGGMIVPLDGGYTERAEFHYSCTSSTPPTSSAPAERYSNSKIFNCEKNCREVYADSPFSELNECLQRNCK